MPSVDEIFGDLEDPKRKIQDTDLPGKRLPAQRDQPPRTRKGRTGPTPLVAWDDNPRSYRLNGVQQEFFTIRHVGAAVNRSPRTIRLWERLEAIPPATFRSSTPKNARLKGTGDRLWTRAQVEAIVKAAEEEGVLDGNPPSKAFTAKVVKAFLDLQQQ